jgi:Tfp pilus assembly PilM family ATPase
VVQGHAVEQVPDGAVVPALNATNVQNRQAVVEALGRALARIGQRPRRTVLVVPDSIAKVSLVRFENVPARSDDLEQMIRFQIRKSAPFRLDEAQVTFDGASALTDGGREFVVVVARRDVVAEYEQVCAEVGADAGVVDLATFNLINATLAGAPDVVGDWLLVHVTPEYSTLAIMRGRDLIFFRNRTAQGDEEVADLVHQTAMYYQDRLGGTGFSRILLAGAPNAAEGGEAAARIVENMRRTLEARLRTDVEAVDPTKAAPLADRIAANPVLLDALAPAVGLVLRGQTA